MENTQQRLQHFQARTYKLEADLEVARGKHASLEERIIVVEQDRTTMENQMLKAIEEASISRAEGHAAEVIAGQAEWAQEKAKFL